MPRRKLERTLHPSQGLVDLACVEMIEGDIEGDFGAVRRQHAGLTGCCIRLFPVGLRIERRIVHGKKRQLVRQHRVGGAEPGVAFDRPAGERNPLELPSEAVRFQSRRPGSQDEQLDRGRADLRFERALGEEVQLQSKVENHRICELFGNGIVR